MNEIQMVGALLDAPEPTPEMAERSMRTLRRTMAGAAPAPARRRLPRRPLLAVLATGLAASAAAAVAVLPGGSTGSPPPAELDARGVLLAAAATADRQSAGAGTYWRVTRTRTKPDGSKHDVVLWVRRDGRAWISRRPGLISELPPQRLTASRLGLTPGQIARLPTEPQALAEVLARPRRLPPGEERPRPPSASERAALMVAKLTTLVSDAPATPKVRAAAFRVLASLPGVRDLGPGPNGRRLMFAEGGEGAGVRLTVDPATARVTTENFFDFNGAREDMGATTSSGIWTNALPQARKVPLEEQPTTP